MRSSKNTPPVSNEVGPKEAIAAPSQPQPVPEKQINDVLNLRELLEEDIQRREHAITSKVAEFFSKITNKPTNQHQVLDELKDILANCNDETLLTHVVDFAKNYQDFFPDTSHIHQTLKSLLVISQTVSSTTLIQAQLQEAEATETAKIELAKVKKDLAFRVAQVKERDTEIEALSEIIQQQNALLDKQAIAQPGMIPAAPPFTDTVANIPEAPPLPTNAVLSRLPTPELEQPQIGDVCSNLSEALKKQKANLHEPVDEDGKPVEPHHTDFIDPPMIADLKKALDEKFSTALHSHKK